MSIIQMVDIWDDVRAYYVFMQDKNYLELSSGLPIGERFRRIRHNYEIYQQLVDAGLGSWMHTDQYEVGDWVSIFTPIEMAAWQDIRANSLPLWPQLPVGRFFVDFGNPVAKVALECDGKQWHDQQKDARRDAELRELGWSVWRAPGWRCKRVLDRPEDFAEWLPDEQEEFWGRRDAETMAGIIGEIKHYMGRA